MIQRGTLATISDQDLFVTVQQLTARSNVALADLLAHLGEVEWRGPYLGGEHHVEVLRRARFRSKRELLRLIAEIDPKPEVPALVEPIGPAPSGPATHRALVEALSGPVRDLQVGSRPEDWIAGPARQ